MNRRNFLRSLIGGIAAAAAVRTFPFRVYSFGSPVNPYVDTDWIKRLTYLEWDEQRSIWYVSPDQAKVAHELGMRFYAVPPYPSATWKGLNRSPYPGRLISLDAFRGIPIAGITQEDLHAAIEVQLTEGIEQQDLLLRGTESNRSRWQRLIHRA